MPSPQTEIRITRTYLSLKPSPNSFLVMIFSLLVSALLSQAHWSEWRGWHEFLSASQELVFEKGEYWRLWTSLLIHGDYQHFFSNAYMLFILGYFVYGYFGGLVYLLAWGLGGLVAYISLWTYPPQVHLVGASGVIYLLAGFWLSLFVFIERKRTLAQRLLRACGVALVILFPTSFQPQTSYRAHFFGFAVGVFFAILFFLSNKKKIRSYEVQEMIVDDEDEELPS